MENDKTIEFLKTLNENGVNIRTSIKALIDSRFPITSDSKARYIDTKVYLGKLRDSGYIAYEIKQFENTGKIEYITASLTIDGYRFLNDLERDMQMVSSSKKQTNVLIATLVLSGASVIISFLSYKVANDALKSTIDQLQHTTSQKTQSPAQKPLLKPKAIDTPLKKIQKGEIH
ncbi:MAG: hypothetical protein ABIN91_07810 [Mucilaginibacter sp.]|uniref:hypothetical protein n=1 Tax=Mucilaginibacter sp. TaxID=1882438 RepID=UPI003265A520